MRLTRIIAFINELGVVNEVEKGKAIKNGSVQVSPSDLEAVNRVLNFRGDAPKAPRSDDVMTVNRARASTAPDIPFGDTIVKPPRDDSNVVPVVPSVASEFKLWGDLNPLVRVASDPRPDEDFDDEVIVFRPAFSRVISPFPSASNVFEDEDRNGRYSFDQRVKSSSSLASLSSADADPVNHRFPGLLTETSRRSFSEDFIIKKHVVPPPGFSAAVPTPPGFETFYPAGYPINSAPSNLMAQEQIPDFDYRGSDLNEKDIFQKLW